MTGQAAGPGDVGSDAGRVVLASGSRTRIDMLRAAGVVFEASPSRIDERLVEAPLIASGVSSPDLALALAEAKARDVSRREPGAVVIGADQVLDLGGRRLTKPGSIDEARAQLVVLAGRSHKLHSAVVAVEGSDVVWRHVGTATLTVRPLDGAEIDAYLARVGDGALDSVGAYQIEGPGIQLFDGIEGDYFTILGLPLLPFLKWLRGRGLM